MKFYFFKNLIKKNYQLFFNCIHFLLIILFITSCIEAPKSKRLSTTASKTTSTSTPTSTLPTFSNGNNFFQNGGTTFTGTFTLDIDFTDTYYFRGKEVDSYIRNINNSTPICMVNRFQQSGVNKIVLLAMMPRSTYNFTNQSIEYYYSLSPSDETNNQNYCQKTSLINKLFTLYPTLTLTYKIKSLCASGVCSSSGYTSEPISLFASNGSQLTTMSTAGLIYFIKNTLTTNSSSGSTCTTSSECKTQGYDCCSGNQCVKDLQKKGGLDETTNEYKQSLQDILNNPSAIYNYPQYYYICSTNVNQPTPPTPNSSIDIIAAQKRVDTLSSYFTCVNKVHGEYGVCTKTETNASIGVPYSVATDDRSFVNTYTNTDIDSKTLVSIEKIYYGEVLLFDYSTKSLSDLAAPIYTDTYITINGLHNDDLTTGANVTINAKPPGAVSSELIIKYKVDSSCVFINSTTAKCEKYFLQGKQNYGSTFADHLMGRVTEHYPASNDYKLPTYANTSKTLKVEVDGVQIIQGLDWDLVNGTPSYITTYLNSNGSPKAQDGQIVKITYFASTDVMPSKIAAMEKIKTACSCSDYNCNLAPTRNTSGAITDFVCVYPQSNPVTVPLSQTVYLSSKSVPVRFYDNAGSSQKVVNSDTLPQEETAFKYTNNDLSKPNNLTGYIGFNEIYGSLSYGTNSAKPPKVIDVKKGSSYDIYVDNGSFYTCSQCGADYYSQINKLFPSMQFGGGLTPMQFQANKIATTSTMIRADEFAFGRACFVPATMIPWSHYISSDVQTQRTNRLKTQHFLFANGYQRDWFGFDYGAVIGSFDGVKWFAIGTNRRIKAASNKLFLAVNGHFGDLTIESTYSVAINDATLNPAGTGMVTTDLESDGAECQKYHQCNNDQDCNARLGPDYTCSAVTEITTSWPVFDENANEVADTTSENNQLTSILGVSNPGKRCVYRGKGALCTQNYQAINTNSTFNKTSIADFHACSSNNFCQSFAGTSGLNQNFNNRVNRYGKVVPDSTRDSFGLGAPVTMRPFTFNGSEEIRTETLHNLSATKAIAMCIPGKMPEEDNFVATNKTTPDFTNYPGDRVVGIGSTLSALTGGAGYSEPSYMANCGILDSNGEYFYKSLANPASSNETNSTLVYASGSQATSTNSLYLFKSIFQSKGLTLGIFSSPTSILSSLSFQQNTCLRPAGASCNTDLECAPSKPITDKTKLITSSDTTVSSILNQYEVKYWQENLVCSQAAEKTAAAFDPKDNKCCREIGNTISIGQRTSDISLPGYLLNTTGVPGIDIAFNQQNRYSRVATYYKEYKEDAITYPSLEVPKVDQCTNNTTSAGCLSASKLTNQFNTIDLVGRKTSCSNGWVRNFANGNHNWGPTRLQSFTTSSFKCYNWAPNSTGNWTCKDMSIDSPECTVIQTSPTSSKAKGILKFLGKLELLGIPQVTLPTEDQYMTASEGDLSCKSHPSSQSMPYPGDKIGTNDNYKPPFAFWSNYKESDVGSYAVATAPNKREVYDATTGTQLYSAIDSTNFYSGFKPIFKSDEIVACAPTGTKMTNATDLNKCCSGYINPTNMKCALPDFTDISVYTNKYVSSESNGINAALFDEDGYIKDPSIVYQLACSKNMCASGKVAFGVLISNLKVPGQLNSSTKFFRFLQSSAAEDDANGLLTIFNQGLKLNNHAYCMANGQTGPASNDITILPCN